MNNHIPVLLERVLETLGDISGVDIVDATFGAGGYSRAFLERGANVTAFDRDSSVQKFADELKSEFGERFHFINDKFSNIASHVQQSTNIVFDFGISSMQIDTPERGFSWRFDAPLDMRMENSDGVTCIEFIKNSTVPQIASVLRDYGDIKKAGIIAHAIKEKLPKTTFELRDLIYTPRDVAPVFQALRIAVNDELREIERALNSVPNLLNDWGKCICVTFHSLEDRLVKQKFKELTTPIGDPRMPQLPAGFQSLKTYRPDEEEIAENPRSRSSHLRAIQKNSTIA